MRAWAWVPLLVAWGLAAAAARAAEGREVEGKVFDADGNPVAGIQVAPFWTQTDGVLVPREAMTTDADGTFRGTLRWQGRSRSLLALSADRGLGAVATVEGEPGEPFTLHLVPTVRVRQTYSCAGLGQDPERTWVSVTASPAAIGVVSVVTTTELSLPLPPGRYHLSVGATDCRRERAVLEILAEDREKDLGILDLAPTVIALHHGKAPPAWTVTDARGAEPTVALADLRGKWVLLEFWGFW